MSLENIKALGKAGTWKFWTRNEEARIARRLDDPDIDPHYKLMLRNKYKECPQWWWFAVFAVSFAVGLACLYVMKVSLLPPPPPPKAHHTHQTPTNMNENNSPRSPGGASSSPP
jgi:hypothetical protein